MYHKTFSCPAPKSFCTFKEKRKETLEKEGNALKIVYHETSSTNLCWVEPHEFAHEASRFCYLPILLIFRAAKSIFFIDPIFSKHTSETILITHTQEIERPKDSLFKLINLLKNRVSSQHSFRYCRRYTCFKKLCTRTKKRWIFPQKNHCTYFLKNEIVDLSSPFLLPNIPLFDFNLLSSLSKKLIPINSSKISVLDTSRTLYIWRIICLWFWVK